MVPVLNGVMGKKGTGVACVGVGHGSLFSSVPVFLRPTDFGICHPTFADAAGLKGIGRSDLRALPRLD